MYFIINVLIKDFCQWTLYTLIKFLMRMGVSLFFTKLKVRIEQAKLRML